MRLFRRHRALVCRQAVDLMADYLEARLDADQVRRLEAHLAGCPHCTEYLAQLRVTIDALGHADPAHLDDEAVDDLVHLYRQWRAEDP